MSIIRVEHSRDRPYLMLSVDTIRSTSLSCAGLGFLVRVLDLPDDWQINIRGLAKRFHLGKNTVARRLEDLRRAGHCQVQTTRLASGRFESAYVVYECPKAASTRKGDRPASTQNTCPVNGDVLITNLRNRGEKNVEHSLASEKDTERDPSQGGFSQYLKDRAKRQTA